MKSKEVTT